MKKKLLRSLLFVLLICIAVGVFSACETVGGVNDGTGDADENGYAPYTLTYLSNRDGTCSVTKIEIDANASTDFTLTVPATSPEGNTVTAITAEPFENNVLPLLLLEDDYQALKQKLEKAVENERLERFYCQKTLAYFQLKSWKEEMTDAEKAELLEKYPIVEITNVYAFASDATEEESAWIREVLLTYTDWSVTDVAKTYQNLYDLVNKSTSENKDTMLKSLPEIPTALSDLITCIKLPDSLESMNWEFVTSCRSLKTISLPDCVTEIPENAFAMNPKLSTVVIPESVKAIGAKAFTMCTALKSVTFEAKSGWLAGADQVTLTDPEQNALYLRDIYADLMWSNRNASAEDNDQNDATATTTPNENEGTPNAPENQRPSNPDSGEDLPEVSTDTQEPAPSPVLPNDKEDQTDAPDEEVTTPPTQGETDPDKGETEPPKEEETDSDEEVTTPPKEEETDSDEEVTTPPEEGTDPIEPPPATPKWWEGLDYKGKEIKILLGNTFANTEWNTYSDDPTTAIDQALYERNIATEEALNICLVYTVNDVRTINQTVMNSHMAGDSAYDILSNTAYYSTQLATQGFYCNLNDLEYIDLEQSCWNSNFNDLAEINEKLYFATGALNLTVYERAYVMFYNETMAEDYGLGDVYEVVFDGKWTFEKMREYVNNVYNDLNDNGICDNGDSIGIVTQSSRNASVPFLFGGGISLTEFNQETEQYELVSVAEPMVNMMNDLQKMWYNDQGAYLAEGGSTTALEIFSGERTLFLVDTMSQKDTLHQLDAFELGVLPMPKRDADQADYHTSVAIQTIVTVLSNTADRSSTSAVLEYLCEYSAETVVPCYKEELSFRYFDSPDATKTVSMIFDSIGWDFIEVHAYATSNAVNSLWITPFKAQTNVITALEGNRPAIKAQISELYTQFSKIK